MGKHLAHDKNTEFAESYVAEQEYGLFVRAKHLGPIGARNLALFLEKWADEQEDGEE